ncbi:glycosyltransferase Family 34 protein [Gigaspora margarita]|uniref:Glycosyltransferase Family 34 protein n=1 Tax=Gigaspora margarita TaxID=4874 RepID=A0A8H4AXA5_GIGMA|nr:glycosyltransferase Family 34 protein [Gigaspora margarita]
MTRYPNEIVFLRLFRRTLGKRIQRFIVLCLILLFFNYVLNTLNINQGPYLQYGAMFKNEGHSINTFNDSITSVSHKLLVVIASHVTEIKTRKVIREFMFGIKNSLRQCMEQNGSIYYKFLVKIYQGVNYKILKEFKAEVMEYDDIVEFPNMTVNVDWQKIVLTWIQSLEKEISYDYVAIIDSHSVLDLKKLQQILDSSVINTYTLTSKQKFYLVWGRFDIQTADDMFIILGRGSIDILLNFDYFTMQNRNKTLTELFPNRISMAYYYFEVENLTNESKLFFINDQIGMIEWTNSVKTIPIEKTIGVGHVYLEIDVRDLIAHLSITKSTICHPIKHEHGKLSIALVTSSFIYDDMCMYHIADNITENKRRYAKKHGYSFVARSEEYTQQRFKKRKDVWGKIDVIEKVLPHYDWVFWMDMDAVIANHDITIEQLFENFEKMIGKEKFNEISFVIARPKYDSMVSAGVFLIKNSEWSRKFLRETQKQRRYYNYGLREQLAMAVLMRREEYKNGALYLNEDDRTFNTYPDRYIPRGFVVHWAPDYKCPAENVLDGIKKLKNYEVNREYTFTLTHSPVPTELLIDQSEDQILL